MLFEMRWRKPPPRPVLRIAAWTLSVLLHVLVLVALILARPLPYAPPSTSGKGVIDVRFIQAPPKPPPPPTPPKLPVRRAAQRHVATAPHSGPVALPDMTVVAPKQRTAKSRASKKPAKPVPRHKAAVARTPAPAPHAVSPTPVPEAPPPPRVVQQVTPVSLPEPKMSSDAASPVSSPSSRDVPVAVPRLQVAAQTPQSGFQAPPDEHPHASLQGVTLADVTPAPGRAPAPTIQPQASRPDIVAPSVQPQSQQVSPTQVTPTAQAPGASVAAPQIDLPHVPAQVDMPALPQARPGPLALPTAPQPVATRRAPRPATSVASAPAPATTSWAKTSAGDHFATRKAPSGKGVRLYGKHGSLALSGGTGKSGTPDYIQRQPQGNSDVMERNTSSIHYTSTRFNKYWTPLGETALQTAFRHLVEDLTYTKTIHMTRGARIKCAFSPLMLMSFFSCGSGNPPSPPPPTDGDRRLDMAPAAPLVKGLGPKPAASAPSPPLPTRDTTSCVTARIAGSPPRPGVPCRTRNRKNRISGDAMRWSWDGSRNDE